MFFVFFCFDGFSHRTIGDTTGLYEKDPVSAGETAHANGNGNTSPHSFLLLLFLTKELHALWQNG